MRTSPRFAPRSTPTERAPRRARETRAPEGPRPHARAAWPCVVLPAGPADHRRVIGVCRVSGSVGRLGDRSKTSATRSRAHSDDESPRPGATSAVVVAAVIGGSGTRMNDDQGAARTLDGVRSARTDVMHGSLLPTWDKRSVGRLTLSVTNLQGFRGLLDNNAVARQFAAHSVAASLPTRSVAAARSTDRLQSVVCNLRTSCHTVHRSCSWTRSSTSTPGSPLELAGD